MKRRRSWFRLLVLCATTTLLVALAVAVFIASGIVLFVICSTVSPFADDAGKTIVSELASQQGTAADGETFSGLLTDDHCGARHDMGSNKSPAECARACVRNGAKYALVAGDKSYTLKGNAEDFSRQSGQRVTLLGSLEGKIIQVSSIPSN